MKSNIRILKKHDNRKDNCSKILNDRTVACTSSFAFQKPKSSYLETNPLRREAAKTARALRPSYIKTSETLISVSTPVLIEKRPNETKSSCEKFTSKLRFLLTDLMNNVIPKNEGLPQKRTHSDLSPQNNLATVNK